MTPQPTPTSELTKPPAMVVQPQLPLPTYVRWAIDKGSPDDPERRSQLVLFFDGQASWRIVDATGVIVLRVPIPGSGIFGPETCLVTERRPQENTVWRSVDAATLDSFIRNYRTYRAVAEGIFAGEATLELMDTGCRRT